MIWRLMRGMLLHKGDDVRDDSGGCLGDGLNRQMRSQMYLKRAGNMDQNLRSISWWLNFDPYPPPW